ncbi:aminopeptidase P family N-terminal domain-containing protein [Neobacillus sp. MM2021_6]|uniref:M24 family metallopeptidase n=1 Tax=Bacillaceae TaxID=186817 RepID=UPI00140A7B5D|nr:MULTISPECIES: aminopeptidase P family protein [Bacillaceae]MBO0961025.1 aminopeptidase P family N-terminal domain-containing protein [Neobacillus sp. MM2021_6]NHC19063.1 Xaa-Pro aminopeptidase [Bacillus sp. MM2020_4]
MEHLKEKYSLDKFSLAKVNYLDLKFNDQPPVLSDQTLSERKEKLLTAMKEKGVDLIFIYADREHGANFEYFTGFIPRFEEALVAIDATGASTLFLGNENGKLATYSRLEADLVHVPHFSLPNQPMDNHKSFKDIIGDAIHFGGKNIGVVGWKVFTSRVEENQQLFDVPYFIVDALQQLAREHSAKVMNGSALLMGENGGIRTINNADEIHYYEFGSSLASDCVLDALHHLEIGQTETELASFLSRFGQPHNVTTICATGDRFTNAVLYPRKKEVALGDRFSITTGYKGGLASRSGYVVTKTEELPNEVQDYLARVAIPYYAAVVAWLENIKIGMTGGQLYDVMETVLPKEDYHWHLNPGHFTADEEWLSSPVYPESSTVLKSGMVFQIDIIPSVPNYGGASAETGIALADEALRNEIANTYPELWDRFVKRRMYMEQELHIQLQPEVLPLADTVGYFRPYLLNKEEALLFQPNP